MIRIASFPIDKFDEANAFMDTHQPRSTEKQNGIVFHNGNIVIIYDDNRLVSTNPIARVSNLLQDEKDKILNNKIVMAMGKDGLERFAPKGYDPKMSDTKLKDLIQQANPTLGYNDIKEIVSRLTLYTNQVLQAEFTIKESEFAVKVYEKMHADFIEAEKSEMSKIKKDNGSKPTKGK